MEWDNSYILEFLPVLLGGFGVTIKATLGGSFLALVFGLCFALALRSGSRAARIFATCVVEFIRRTPLLVQLFIIFFVLPELGILLPALWAGILALGLHTGAYMAEVFRAGIDSVPKGQWEGAVALNYPRRDIWVRIILPQAIPPMVPALGNYVVLMFKESALLAAITVPEAMNTARDIGNATYRYLEPMTVVGMVYLLISIPIVLILRALERRVRVEQQ